jgi:uncharacterized membrane protein
VAILVGFAPWIVYWVLVGNVPFAVSALSALAIAVAVAVIGRVKKAPGRILEIGSVATFAALAALSVWSADFAGRWAQPVSFAAVFLVALTGVLTSKPFVREFAEVGQPPTVISSESFVRITTHLTWVWTAAFAGMTVSSAIPPMLQGSASILDTRTPLSFVGYWVIPFLLLSVTALTARLLPEPTTVRPDDAPRKTTFVAYGEATIDELYYLAQQHADREIGAGQEAYDVKVGGLGTPLVGDDSRKSWPSTYKVREARR